MPNTPTCLELGGPVQGIGIGQLAAFEHAIGDCAATRGKHVHALMQYQLPRMPTATCLQALDRLHALEQWVYSEVGRVLRLPCCVNFVGRHAGRA